MSTNSQKKGPTLPKGGPKRPAAQSAVVRPTPIPVAKTNSVSSTVAKDAKLIEKKIEKGGVQMHPGLVDSRTGRRHGQLNRLSVGMTEHGMCHTFQGVERMGVIVAPVSTNEGDILDKAQLNPTSFGVVLPQFAKPFAKFLFTRVEFEEVPEISSVNTEAYGSVYFGLNFDPDAELPYGPTGVNSVSTWYPNEDVLPLKATKEKRLQAKLDQASQIPLFVGLNGDEKFESQAQMVVLAGTPLNTGASAPISVGEWFIHYTVKLYQLNTTPADLGSSFAIGHSDAATSLVGDLDASGMNWIGHGDAVIYSSYADTGVSFITPVNGTYMIETTANCTTAAATILNQPSLIYFTVPNQPIPITIAGSFLTSTPTGTAENPCTMIFGPATTQGLVTSNAGAASLPVAGSIFKRWVFTCVQGTPFRLLGATASAGTYDYTISITRLDNVFHKDGQLAERANINTALSFADIRTQFHTMKNLTFAAFTDNDRLIVMKKINELRLDGKADEPMISVLIDQLNLPIPKCSTTTMIIPALVAVASWAVVTFGPILAEKACNFIVEKLEGKKKK